MNSFAAPKNLIRCGGWGFNGFEMELTVMLNDVDGDGRPVYIVVY